MSLSIPRPTERASVMLPTVTCSSCSAPIPLNSLGDHVCLPPSRATGSRAVPRPSQLSIPSTKPTARSPLAGSSPLGRSEPSSSSSASSSSRPFAGPSSVSSGSGSGSARRQAPPALDIPPRDFSARAPSPLSGGGQYLTEPPTASSSRTPSPTNPFFPHRTEGDGVVVHGLGLGVGGSSRREGPYPTDRPLPAGITGPGLQDGAAGMAGVGRRAFAAAAWGVRAGVAMAHAGAQRVSPVEQTFSQPIQNQSNSPTVSHVPLEPPRPTEPRARSPFGNGQGNATMPVPQVTGEDQRPRVPLANRPSYSRNPSVSSTSTHVPSDERISSAMSRRSVAAPLPSTHRRADSSSSSGSRDDSISQLLRARADPSQQQGKKPAFFEKYKQLVGATDGRGSPILSLANPDKISSSPENATLRIEDEDDDEGESALPWMQATPNASPAIPQVPSPKPTLAPRSVSQVHSRQHTLDSSSGHSSSSSRSGGNGGSGPESEEVVTPSQSWEGSLVDRVGGLARKVGDRELEKIGEEEEDEGDRVVFNTGLHPNSQYRPATSLARRDQPETKDTPAFPPHVRSHTAPSPRPSLGQRSGSKRTKQCQNCLEIVGGTRRFVERDGIVLCEKDWKKLYLPSCRRCQLPIEKSAVSSSDGQLKGKWHKECFSCTKCSMPFEGDSFYVLHGKPWCQYHYHEEK